VYARIGTASSAVRVLREVLTICQRVGVVEGVFVCLDEIETVFRGGMRGAQYQAFLQDLRYFYDAAVKDGTGFSLIIAGAATPGGASDLLAVNYAVYQRLGFERDTRALLAPIRGKEQAAQLADAYVAHGRSVWAKERKRPVPLGIASALSDEDIEKAFEAALRTSDAEMRSRSSVNQAPLLESFHARFEERRLSQG
jgi:hypothetical protein